MFEKFMKRLDPKDMQAKGEEGTTWGFFETDNINAYIIVRGNKVIQK